MLYRRIIYATFLVLVLILNVFYNGVIAFYILAVAVAVPLISFCISLPKKVKIELSLPETINAGELVKLNIRITGRKLFPVGCIVFSFSINNEMTGSITGAKKYVLYGCDDSLLSYTVRTDECGRVRCEMKDIAMYDYTGLFCRSLKKEIRAFMNVFPIPEPIHPSPVIPLGELRGVIYKPKLGGGFGEDYDIRDYRPGDPINQIHWKLTVKKDQPVIREVLIGEKAKALVTFDMSGKGKSVSNMLARLLWLLRWLVAQRVQPYVKWYDCSQDTVHTCYITSKSDVIDLFAQLFVTRLDNSGHTLENAFFDGYAWHYHVRTERSASDEQ